jgi:hypothetical protein
VSEEPLAYLESLARRRDAASGGWHMARDATIEALVAFVREPSADHEKRLRATWEALGVAETVRGELLLEHVTHIIARVQSNVLDVQHEVKTMHAELAAHRRIEEDMARRAAETAAQATEQRVHLLNEVAYMRRLLEDRP